MGCLKFKLDDFNPQQQARIKAQLAPRNQDHLAQATKTVSKPTQSSGDAVKIRACDYKPSAVVKPPLKEWHGNPNKTEQEFNDKFLNGKGRYEAITFRLPGGALYTPDWFYFDNGIPTFVECKGAFHFASHGRSVTAFKETVALFPFWNFIWASKKKGGVWDLKKLEGEAVV